MAIEDLISRIMEKGGDVLIKGLEGSIFKGAFVLVSILILFAVIAYLAFLLYKRKLNIKSELEILKDTGHGTISYTTLLKYFRTDDNTYKYVRADNDLEIPPPPENLAFFRPKGKKKTKYFAYEDKDSNLHYCKFQSHFIHPKTKERLPLFTPLPSSIKRWLFQTIRSKFERYRFIDELTKWQPALIIVAGIIATALIIITQSI